MTVRRNITQTSTTAFRAIRDSHTFAHTLGPKAYELELSTAIT